MALRSHAERVAEGRRLIAAATLTDTRPIAGAWARFTKTHATYDALSTKLEQAEAPLARQQIRLAEADADQDAAVARLADALVGDGLPRKNPFKAFGSASPGALADFGQVREAKACLALARAVRKRPGLGKPSAAAANALEKAANAVLAAAAGMGRHAKPVREARAARDVAVLHWKTTYAALKRAAAADSGATGLVAALFGTAPKAPRRAKKKAGASPPT